MFLSEWFLDKKTLLSKAIINDYRIHQQVFDLFPNSSERNFLFCSEGVGGCEMRILIQSEAKPIIPNYGMLEVKEINESFFNHGSYLFKSKFCPVIQKSHSKEVIPLKSEGDILNWLMSRQNDWGIDIYPESFLKIGDGRMSMEQRANPRNITIDYVEVTGVLSVNNRELFLKMIKYGIGRSKGFGLGLVQLRPIFK